MAESEITNPDKQPPVSSIKPSSPIGFVEKLLITHWRSLLVLFVGVYIPLQIFGLLALTVRYNEGGFPWDLPILVAVHSLAQPHLDIFAAILTKFGSFWTALPVLSLLVLTLLVKRRWRSLTYILITAAGSAAINHTAKEFWHRVRPHLWDSVAPEFDYAFPSGHAMTSMTLLAILLVLTWGSGWRWLTLIFGTVYVLGIGWTRLYLGVHFPSDIIAGWMVAIAWAIGVSLIIQPSSQPINDTKRELVMETKLLTQEEELLNQE